MSDPYYAEDGITIYQGDARQIDLSGDVIGTFITRGTLSDRDRTR